MSRASLKPTNANSDRLPPHAADAEAALLGCLLISPNDCIGKCVDLMKTGAETFYDLRHQIIYATLVRMFDDKTPIDIVTVAQRLKDEKHEFGNLSYLASLPDLTPSTANLEHYIGIVKEKYTLRKIISTCATVTGRAFDHDGSVAELLDGCESLFLKISEDSQTGESVNIKTLVGKAIGKMEDYHQRQGALSGLGTGFSDFDQMTGGLNGGEMIVIAARPSMGKTSLAMNIAESVAIEQQLPVGVFSLEMTAESLVLRMISSRARVNLRDVRDGILSADSFAKLTVASNKIATSKLHIDDSPGLSILQLRAKARRMHQQHGIKLFVIDYLQLMHSTRRTESRQQEIADISNGVKSLAKELNVPVIILSQLNRDIEKDKNRKPRLSDLRESGEIEQDADLVAMLYKKDNGDDDENTSAKAIAVNLLIAKQRNGPTGDVHLMFLKEFTRFAPASKVSDEDVR